MQGGIGIVRYTNNDILRNRPDFSYVWSTGVQGEHWWHLTPKWSVAAGLGVRLRYNRLQSRLNLDNLAPLIELNAAPEEAQLSLRWAEHAVTLATVAGQAEYSLCQGSFYDVRLHTGILLERMVVANVNSVYREPSNAYFSLFDPEPLQSTASEADVNDYFRERLPNWQAAVQIGISLQFFRRTRVDRRFYLFWLYEQGFVPLSRELGRAEIGIRGGTGYRFGR